MQQTSSTSATWDGELQRVVQWLSSRKRQREQQQTSILARVNTHLQFVHAQKRDREQEMEENLLEDDDDSANSNGDDDEEMPEADLGLGFLDGVNAEDIKSLLEAEAARSASGDAQPVAAVTIDDSSKGSEAVNATSAEPNMLALIEMPSHLLSKNSPPKLYASPAKHIQLQPKFVVPPPLRLSPSKTTRKVHVGSLTSVQLDEDAGVTELMNELDLDISDVVHYLPPETAHHNDREEHKSEEGTPSHMKASRPQAHDQARPTNAMEALKQSVFSDSAKKKKSRNFMRDGSDESGDESGRSVENARLAHKPMNPDEVGAEMHSWVTGYRDPEVLRRKEAMAQRNRRPTARFGVNSVEEQRYINKAAKYYAEGKDAGSSDSESSVSVGSDFSPDEVDDQDDPVSDVELLSDDYLNEDTEKAASSSSSKGKPRRRLRNQHKDINKSKRRAKKAGCAVKGANTATSSPAKANSTVSTSSINRDSANVSGSRATALDRQKSDSNGHVHETIDLLSSDDGSDGSAIERVVNRENSTNTNTSAGRIPRGTDAASQVRTKEKEAMILRLNLPKSMRERTSSAPTTASANQAVSQGSAKRVNEPQQSAVNGVEAASGNGTAQSAEEPVVNGYGNQVRSEYVPAVDNGGDVSDVGTADFEMDMVEDSNDKNDEQSRVSAVTAPNTSEVALAPTAKTPVVNANIPKPQETAIPAANTTAKTPSTKELKESDKKVRSSVTSVGLSEASLAKHNLVENAKTAQPTDTEKQLGSANKDDESEAETLDFDDVEEDLSDDADFEFEGGVEESATNRQDDLGFSDDDSGASDEKPGVVAPHDDDYEQFFVDTPLRKLKVKQKQQQEQKQTGEAKSSTQAKATEKPTDNSNKNVKPPDPKAAAVPANGTKNKSPAAAVTKELTGSNGLRKATKPAAIAMSTVLKRKFQHSRRSIKVIDDGVDRFVNGKRSSSAGVYAVGTASSVKKSRFSEPLVQNQEIYSSSRLTQEFISSISTPEKRQRSIDQRGSSKLTNSNGGNRAGKKPQDNDEERYLSYGGKSNGTKAKSYDSDDEPLSTSVRGGKGSRFGDKDSSSKNGSWSPPEKSQSSSSWSFSSAVSSSNENMDLNPKNPKYPRERQLDIHDALHIEGQRENGLTSRDLRDGEYKRPSAFKKVQEEKEKRGIAFVPREKFMENAPIPKKKKVPANQQPAAKAAPVPSDDKRSNGSSDKRLNPENREAKQPARQKDSHYGPSSGESVSSTKKSYSERSSDSKSYSSSKSSLSLSSVHKGKGKQSKYDKSKSSQRSNDMYDRHRFSSSSRDRDDKDRGRRRDRSRSRSPIWKNDRYVDESSRKRYRSLSRSRSRDRDERSSQSSRIGDRGDRFGSSGSKDSQEFGSDKKRDKSPSAEARTGSESRKRARSLDHNDGSKAFVSARKNNFEDRDQRDAKRAKPVDPRTRPLQKDNHGGRVEDKKPSAPPLPGTLFDSESDMYISDSDGELDESDSKATDIRFDLESVQVDQRQLKRRVYVSGINGMMDEEVLEELFAPFGIEMDRESGFPSIDVFLCQRSLRPRGDACVTFAEEDGAINAVEEINAKIVKNCQIEVRRMEPATQRVLNAQFLSPRESWKCVSAKCRADVSIWNNKCDKCCRKRMFGPSRVRITSNDWLCSICFTANADLSTECHTCNASLPPTNRAQFYKK